MIRQNTMDELTDSGVQLNVVLQSDQLIVVNNDVNNDTNNDTNNIGYKITSIEILISIMLHTFIMAVFEIYFYFQYIIIIEKELFLNKISEYTIQLNRYYDSNINAQQHQLILILFPQKTTQQALDTIYKEYQKSLQQQHELLESLLIRSYKMLVVITSILLLFLTIGFYNYKHTIKWKHIFIENILMFLCLGVFEFIFFMNIILHYSPITDEEIKYKVAKQLLEPFLGNTTQIQRHKYLL